MMAITTERRARMVAEALATAKHRVAAYRKVARRKYHVGFLSEFESTPDVRIVPAREDGRLS